MPQGSGVHASTQDNTSGTLVAQAAEEVSGAGSIQTVAPEGNKSTYTEGSRTSLTTVDTATDLSTAGFAGTGGANLTDLGNALSVAVRASCTIASSVLSGRVVFYDGSNNPIAVSEELSFTSDSALRLSSAGDYISQRLLIDAGSARKARFYVDSMSGTSPSWSVYMRPV